MNEIESLHKWYEQINVHISESGLINLSEYKTENGEMPFAKFTEITRSKNNLVAFSYSDFKHGDEFNFLSQDLIYIIAVIELLHPHINNLIEENGIYNQTVEDHLYLRYAGFGFQVIYSYWDRIGDILAIFFQTGLIGDVYLARVFNNFPKEYKSRTFENLLKLYQKEVEPVLTDRHGVVHGFGLKSKFFWEAMEKSENEFDLENLQHEKDSYPTLFRKQLEIFFNAFTLAMKLISELPDKAIAEGNNIY
jgi:Cthe_2314-like HEPN